MFKHVLDVGVMSFAYRFISISVLSYSIRTDFNDYSLDYN